MNEPIYKYEQQSAFESKSSHAKNFLRKILVSVFRVDSGAQPKISREMSLQRVEAPVAIFEKKESPLEKENEVKKAVEPKQEATISLEKDVTTGKKPPKKRNFELPKVFLNRVRAGFDSAFPKYQKQFSETPINYLMGRNKITEQDYAAVKDLLNEEGTLMNESQPMYEILTQLLSEKALAASGGLEAKVFSFLSKIEGFSTCKLDLPVFLSWKKIENSLVKKYGKEKADEIIEDMYFGEKEDFAKFKEYCLQSGIDFNQEKEKSHKKSLFTNKLYKLALAYPKLYENLLAGSLAMPGKVYDIGSPFFFKAGLIAVLLGFFDVAIGASNPLFITFTIASGAIAASSLPVIVYHEITHVMGGNYRRYLKKSANLANSEA